MRPFAVRSGLFRLQSRGLTKNVHRAKSTTTNAKPSLFETFVAADQTLAQTKLLHKSNLVLAGLFPLAFLASSTPAALPFDLAVAILLPVHTHIGMNFIFTDYVPGKPTGGARIALLAATLLATVGLVKLSFSEKGLIGSVKNVWAGKTEEA